MITTTPPDRDVWGILGGMGPLASAAFLATIYEQSAGVREQELPAVLLLSDPAIPDRTEALLQGREFELADEIGRRAQQLLDGGATKIVFCCVTMHRIVPLLPRAIQNRLVSLVDLIFDAVEQSAGPHVMLCTEGTRRTHVFQDDERWSRVRSKILFLDDDDQSMLHSSIYRIKRNDRVDQHAKRIVELVGRYNATSCIAGCTEMHIVAKRCEQQRYGHAVRWIDPLDLLASRIGGREPVLAVGA